MPSPCVGKAGQGEISLIDRDPNLPYHRPPLSKGFLSKGEGVEKYLLKSREAYNKEGISLALGSLVEKINRQRKCVHLINGDSYDYHKLVIATGARPLVPPINGMESARNLFFLRTAEDASQIRKALEKANSKRVAIIGGGYIGLEVAASLRQIGVKVTVLEREKRLLARVTAPEISAFYLQLHQENGVQIFTQKEVLSIQEEGNERKLICADGSQFDADIILIGVGIQVNQELAEKAGLEVSKGIKVNERGQTSDEDIYAIGDCSYHYHARYGRYLRLESVQSAVDQGKVVASVICGKDTTHSSLPWFWSDQFHIKLQKVGLSMDHNEVHVRPENGKEDCFSIWYFKDETLLAVDAVNNARAYMLGTKFLQSGQTLDKHKLIDPSIELRPANFQ